MQYPHAPPAIILLSVISSCTEKPLTPSRADYCLARASDTTTAVMGVKLRCKPAAYFPIAT